MTRRLFLLAAAAAPLTNPAVERIRRNPRAGDVITGPNGASVEVIEVVKIYTGTEMVYYTTSVPGRGQYAHIARMDEWRGMKNWHEARIG